MIPRALSFLLAAGAAAFGIGAAAQETPEQLEAKYLSTIRQVTFVGGKNGESYFSHDGKGIVFQGVREPENPFYQIYRMDLATGETFRISPGIGKTTCSYFHPKKNRILFASTHMDANSVALQKAEIEKLKSGPPKRYSWDFDSHFDIFEADPDGKNPIRLTEADGYDAECAYSPDGTRIVFCSKRDGDEEIYTMDADGKNPKRLTTEKGYDGGPFFSPDGKKIIWRHFDDEAQKVAEVWTMDADGSNKKQITSLKAVSWAPYYHPSMEWIVFASNFEDPAFEVYAIKPDGSQLTRLTHTQGFDGLPVISPDGGTMMWTSNRNENKSHIFMARLTLPGKDPVPVAAVEPLPKFTERWTALETGGTAGNLEHTVARLFRDAGLKLPNGEAPAEESSFVEGPRVSAAWPKAGKSIALAALLENTPAARFSVVAVIQAAEALKSDEKGAGFYVAAAQDDFLSNTHSASSKAVSKFPNSGGVSAFISVAGLGEVWDNRIVLRGAGSSPGWRLLAERLAALNPNVSIQVEDDPTGQAGVPTFVDAGIPGIALGAPAGEKKELETIEQSLANAARVARDAALLIGNGTIAVPFQKYDAAQARALANASKRPYLGTVPEYQTEGIVGVKLSATREGSPAHAAGIKGGDIIVGLNGQPIKIVEDYLKILESLKVGDEVPLVYQRDGKEITVKVTLGAR